MSLQHFINLRKNNAFAQQKNNNNNSLKKNKKSRVNYKLNIWYTQLKLCFKKKISTKIHFNLNKNFKNTQKKIFTFTTIVGRNWFVQQ